MTLLFQAKKEADNIDKFEGCEINKLTDSISHKKGEFKIFYGIF